MMRTLTTGLMLAALSSACTAQSGGQDEEASSSSQGVSSLDGTGRWTNRGTSLVSCSTPGLGWFSFAPDMSRSCRPGDAASSYSCAPRTKSTMISYFSCVYDANSPIPTGEFTVGSGLYYSNGSHYCQFVSAERYQASAGRPLNWDAIRKYVSIPGSMTSDGECR